MSQKRIFLQQLTPSFFNQSKDIFYTLCEQAADGIFVVDLDGVIRYANKSVKDIAGFTASEYFGKHFEQFVDKKSLEQAVNSFNKVRSGVSVIRDELSVVDKKGQSVPVEFTASPIYQNGKIVFIHSIVRNISQKKQLEDLTRGAEKLKTVQHFISGTTKEIQHPLNAVLNHLDYLLEQYSKKDFEYIGYKEFTSIIRALEKMRDQIKKCFETTEKLVIISKRKIGIKDNHCDANGIIKEVVDIFEHEFKASNIKLKLRLSPRLPLIAIGTLELNQVIVNVLNNAIQAIAHDGVIEIKTTYDPSAQNIIVECHDTGMGISKEALKHVFEPFFTTKQDEEAQNLGLGLSIVYSILKASQGNISIRSNLRQGTTVVITLPIYKNHKK